jgi:hypothetical protein
MQNPTWAVYSFHQVLVAVTGALGVDHDRRAQAKERDQAAEGGS